MRAIGYFRETRERSLAQQSESFLEFCRANGYMAAATFLDTENDREGTGFRQLLDFVRQQSAQGFLVVAVPGLESLGGGITEATRRYFQLASLGVPIISMETGADVSAHLLPEWAAHRTEGSLGERVKAAMRRKAVKGEVLGRPPFGYRVGPRRRLVIVPEEGAVVRYIFRLYLKDGLGIRRIARRLNEEGLRTRKGGLWSMVTVRDILRNRAYLGTYSRFGVRVPASHAPLISQDDFQRVQERLDARRPASEARRLSPFLLSGIVYCGYCGNKMIGVTRRQKWQRRADGAIHMAQYRYYQCESRTNRSLCDYHTRRAEELEEEVRKMLLSRRVSRQASVNGTGTTGDLEAEIRRLRLKARRLDRRLEQYMDSAASGLLNEERLRTLCLALGGEQLEVEQKLLQSYRLANEQADEEQRRRSRAQALKLLREDWDGLSFSQRQALMREVLERVIVKDDGVEMVLRS